MNLRKKSILRKKWFWKNFRRYKEIKRRETKIMDNLKKLFKKERKGGELLNHSRYIKNLVHEMMQLGKLLNEYKAKINVILETKYDLFKIVKGNNI